MIMEKRKFPPGEEWLYLKIYTGVKTSDLILEDTIKPLAEYFKANGYISKWFFIRYHDPKPHLRLRFCLKNIQNQSALLRMINKEFHEFIESGEISDFSLETYNREIERYGLSTITEAETLFYKNSEFTLLCLSYDDEDKIIFSLFYIDRILNKLGFGIQEKLEWIKDFNSLFKEEFYADKRLNSQLDKKYRQFKTKLMSFIDSDEFMDEKNAIVFHIEECTQVLQNILLSHQSQSMEISLRNFFQSVFHMNINRLFISNQRLFEMVIYDYLLRYYKSLMFHENKKII